jgi:tyrosyl-tRNA synthetase
LKNIIFEAQGEFFLERDEAKYGVPSKLYKSYQHLEKDFIAGEINPGDLKRSVTKALNRLIEPVRQHFANDPYARELLERVRSY